MIRQWHVCSVPGLQGAASMFTHLSWVASSLIYSNFFPASPLNLRLSFSLGISQLSRTGPNLVSCCCVKKGVRRKNFIGTEQGHLSSVGRVGFPCDELVEMGEVLAVSSWGCRDPLQVIKAGPEVWLPELSKHVGTWLQ